MSLAGGLPVPRGDAARHPEDERYPVAEDRREAPGRAGLPGEPGRHLAAGLDGRRVLRAGRVAVDRERAAPAARQARLQPLEAPRLPSVGRGQADVG
jgi:hypothetical protein